MPYFELNKVELNANDNFSIEKFHSGMNDHLHKLTLRLTESYHFIGIEDLIISEITGNCTKIWRQKNIHTIQTLVVLADQLKTGKIVSVDRKDFSILRWNSGKNSFSNLLYMLNNSYTQKFRFLVYRAENLLC